MCAYICSMPCTLPLLTTLAPALLAVCSLAGVHAGQPAVPAGLPPTFGPSPMPPVTPAPTDLAHLLAPLRDKHNLPALGAVILSSGGVLAQGVIGVRARAFESDTPDLSAQPTDAWHIGSCTKAFTATLAAVMVRQGVLTFDATLADTLSRPGPQGASPITVPESWRAVTLAHLLACSAGVPEDMAAIDGGSAWPRLWDMHHHGRPPAEQRRELALALFKGRPASTPGTRFAYSNASVSMAGLMLEHASGRAYEDLLRDHIAAPLGLSSLGFGAPGTERRATPDAIWGHTRLGLVQPPGPDADNPPAIAPAGAVHLSLADWAAFTRAHLLGARGCIDHASLLDPASYARLHTPVLAKGSDYAMGWITAKRPAWAKGTADGDSGRILTHTGSNTMWLAQVWIAPEIDRALLITTNIASPQANRALEDAALALINHDRASRGLAPLKP
jgi:CubicO group peptidase (beta-lactamase class C family)